MPIREGLPDEVVLEQRPEGKSCACTSGERILDRESGAKALRRGRVWGIARRLECRGSEREANRRQQGDS